VGVCGAEKSEHFLGVCFKVLKESSSQFENILQNLNTHFCGKYVD